MTKEKRSFNLRLILLLGTAIILLLIQVAALLPGVTTPIENIEYIRWAANHLDSPFVQLLIKPNLVLQHPTTRTPDLSMLEVAIQSFQSMRKAEGEVG